MVTLQVSITLAICLTSLPTAGGLHLSRANQQAEPKVVYGVLASRVPKYARVLESHFDTWAAQAFSEGRYFATVGHGPSILTEAHQAALQDSPCEDNYRGIPCKEFYGLREGFRRNADWLVVVGEDNYVNTRELEETLAGLTERYRNQPVALGNNLCELWSCPELPGKKSICGGGGFIWNRAALSLLFEGGESEDQVLQEYTKKAGLPGDVVSGCALQKRGGELVMFYDRILANRIVNKGDMDMAIDHRPLLMHYLNTPEVMRYAHARMLGKQDVDPMGAFDQDNCCCWYNRAAECHNSRGMSFRQYDQLGQINASAFYGRMASQYAAERNQEMSKWHQ